MRRGVLGSAVVALVLVAPAAAGLPKAGRLVPGRSLGGIRLGEPQRAVRAVLGTFYGTCRGCAQKTWYFTYHPFARQGLAVEFAAGRVSAVYTLWRPSGWAASHGLRFGASPLTVHRLGRTTRSVACRGYEALLRDTGHSRTAYYVFDGGLWGFGLFRAGASPCR
jgi:hypothetical protein